MVIFFVTTSIPPSPPSNRSNNIGCELFLYEKTSPLTNLLPHSFPPSRAAAVSYIVVPNSAIFLYPFSFVNVIILSPVLSAFLFIWKLVFLLLVPDLPSRMSKRQASRSFDAWKKNTHTFQHNLCKQECKCYKREHFCNQPLFVHILHRIPFFVNLPKTIFLSIYSSI